MSTPKENFHVGCRRLRLWLKEHPASHQTEMQDAGFSNCSSMLRQLKRHGLVSLKHNSRHQDVWSFCERDEKRNRDKEDWQNLNYSLKDYPR